MMTPSCPVCSGFFLRIELFAAKRKKENKRLVKRGETVYKFSSLKRGMAGKNQTVSVW